eukprot:TRINITY_DN7466_c0_g2_i1.p1 TRINITY_DN7466_c0_g2~~TRINITY_DN7466_c0_g2_i1.p1  ORF type:complete len:313 (-),score=81.23 TRINITY_DN7466_c0_g2_i1:145-1083(-)
MSTLLLARRALPLAAKVMQKSPLFASQASIFAKSSVPARLYSSDGFFSKLKAAAMEVVRGGEQKDSLKYFTHEERQSSTLTDPVENTTGVTSIAIRDETAWDKAWAEIQNRAGGSFLYEKLSIFKERVNDPNNPVVGAGREALDQVSTIAGELLGKDQEYGMVMSEIRARIPHFSLVELVEELEVQILPIVLSSYASGELNKCKTFTSDNFFNFLTSFRQTMQQNGLSMNDTILDVRNTSLFAAQVENEDPSLLIVFQAQQIWHITNAKGETVEGAEDDLRRVTYAVSVTHSLEHQRWMITQLEMVGSSSII